MKRIEETGGSDTSRFGRRNIIAAAAKKTQAIEERKLREKQEELALMELKKRKELRQRDVRNVKGRVQDAQQTAVKRQDSFELQSKQKAKNNRLEQKRIGHKTSQHLSISGKKKEQPTQFFCNEMTEEIDRLKQKSSLQTTPSVDHEKYKIFDDDEKELLEKLSLDHSSATQRMLQYERTAKREQLLLPKAKATQNVPHNNSQNKWDFPQLTKQVDEQKYQTKDDQELKKLQLNYPKIFDSNGRPDCSTPCASSSESEDERFYRRMVGRYRETRHSIVNFIKSGAYSTNDDDHATKQQQNHLN